MADITLTRPQAGQHLVLESVPDSRLVLQFPTDQATMERSGDNLTFTFDDGSSIELTNFYTQYSQESMPEFVVDGALVAGADFFNAFGPDLMPAAGPGAATRAARYNEFGSSDLHDGITHLDGLDYRLAFGAQTTEDVNALGTVGGTGGLLGGIGGQGNQPGIEGDSEVPPPGPAQMGSAEAFLNESAFTSGGNTTSGDIDVTLDGAGTVSVGEIVFDVPAGPFSQQASISTENGVLNVTLSRDADGNLALHYDYAANPEGVEHDKNTGHDELVGDNFKLTVSDGVSSAEGSLDVTIKDGTPTLTVNGGEHAESSVVSDGDTAATAEGSFAFDFGPDNREGKSFTVNGQAFTPPSEGHPAKVEGEFGTLTINADGSYSYTANANSQGTDNFEFTITDADGDSVTANIGVNVTPAVGPDGSTIAHATVNEAGLTDGLAGADRSEVSGALDVPGYTIVGVKQGGQYGTVAKGEDGNWHYTLDRAIDSGDAQGANTVIGADRVTLIVKDGDDNTFEVDVPVDIIDDVPSLDLGGKDYHVVEVGSGASVGQAVGSLHYDFGADSGSGKSFTVSVGDRQYDISDIKEAGSSEIKGEFGTLTINADGSYTYDADPDVRGNAQDSFVLTITDADGDSRDVKLDVTVTPAVGPDGSTIAHATVNEAGLTDGVEGVGSEVSGALDVPGYTIVGVKQDGQYGKVIQDPASGEWRYVLNEAIDSGTAQGANTVLAADTVKLTVQDGDGNIFEVDVPVDIIDDVPSLDLGGKDYHAVEVGSGALLSQAAGGSLHYDFGADSGSGKSFTVSVGDRKYDISDIKEAGFSDIRGEFGWLRINANGSYTYKADPDVRGNAQDSFVLTITDADGDSRDVKLDVTVTPAATIAHATVNEAGLTDGLAGADRSEVSGAIDVPGYTIVGVKQDGQYGTVAKGEDGNWHYTLTGAIDSGDAQGANTVTGADRVTLIVKDGDDNTFEVDVPVDIIDDVPSLDLGGKDYHAVEVGSGALLSQAAGGSLHYDFGADSGSGKSFTVSVGDRKYDISDIKEAGFSDIRGEFGWLRINANGSYTYKADPDVRGNAQDSFVLTITDADGDSRDVKLDVTVTPAVGPDGSTIAHASVNEAGLTDGVKDEGSEVSGALKVPGYTIVGVKQNGAHGTVSRDTATEEWHYTLDKAIDSGGAPGANTVIGADRVTLIVKDGDDNIFEVDVPVDIIDDVPSLDLGGKDYHAVEVGSGALLSQAAGGSLHYDFGADSGSGKSFTVSVGDRKYDISDIKEVGSSEIKGEFGTLTINANGSYTYKADPDVRGNAQDSFVLTITDADGDSRDVKLDVTVTPAATIAHATVNEAGLTDGVKDEGSEVSGALDVPGYTIVGVAGQGQHGKVIQDPATGEWHYTLNEAIDSGNAQGANRVIGADRVTLIVEDGHGNIFEVDVPVDIIDDVPSLDLGGKGYHVLEVGSGASVGQAAGSLHYDFGADSGSGKSFTVSVGDRKYDISDIKEAGSSEIKGEFGTLTINANGSYTYKADPDVRGNAQDSFVLTITDADGDSQDVKLDVTVTPAVGPDGSTIAHVSVNEAGLDDGMDALRAAVQAHAAANGFAIGGGDAGIHQYILDHPEVVGSLDDPSSAADQNDLIVGGAGNDVLAGQDGDDVLLGDGENGQAQGGSSDALNALLGQHAHGSNPAAGVHDLIEHGSPQEIRDFVDGIEGSGVENAQDGNDYLFGGSGDDVLFGQGGDDQLFGGDGSDALFGGSGDDYLDGGNDAAADHLYGGSGNDIIVYHPNDVIDGGSGMDVLLVGNNEDMDRLFQDGSLDGNVSNVEMIVSGDINNLTNLDALKDIGVNIGDNKIDLGDGWQSTDSAHDGFNAWTNGTVTVEVGADVQVSAQDSLQQQAEVAAQKICAENG